MAYRGAVSRPPLELLALAVVAIAASAALLVVADGELVNLAGYVLAMIIASLAIVGYRTVEGRRQSRAGYSRLGARLHLGAVVWVLLAIGIVVGAAHVWRFADAIARR